MLVRKLTMAAVVTVALGACSAIDDQVGTHLESTTIRELENGEPERFPNLGSTTLELRCNRTGQATMDCYSVPITGQVRSCTKYQVTRKSSTDFQQLFLGEINRVTLQGTVPGAQCPQNDSFWSNVLNNAF